MFDLIRERAPIELSIAQFMIPVVAAIITIALASLLREPIRHKLSVVAIAGAGAAYLSGGFGPAEIVFCVLMTFVAYRALDVSNGSKGGWRNITGYQAVALGWILHTVWDIAHHQWGNPIIPFAPSSSFGCAIYDPVLAVWYAKGAPSIWGNDRNRKSVR